MEKILAFLLLGVFYIFYATLSAIFIALSVFRFKEEKYFRFGFNLMTAMLFALRFAELIFKF